MQYDLLKILLLEDDSTDAELIKRTLPKELKAEFFITMNKKGLLKALEEFSPDVILSDNTMPAFNATEALKIVREHSPHTPFILVTGTVSEEFAAGIIKQGADDYILKDRLIRLPAAIDAALRQRQSEKEKLAAMQNLLRSEDKYRTLIERVSDGFIAVDANWNITYVNKAAEKLLGRLAGALTGKNLWVEFPDAVDGPFYKAIHQAMQTQQNINLEDYGAATRRWVHASIYPSRSGVSIYFRDVTEQRKAEKEILDTQKRLEQAQAIAHLGNWSINFETGHSKWSDEAYRIYGLEPGDHNINIERWLSFIHPDDREEVKKMTDESAITLSDLSFFHRIVRPDGTVRHIYSESKYEFNNERKAIGLYGIAHDITEIKKLEAELMDQQKKEQLKITATALEAQEKERNAMGRELHDNVNQILVGTKLMLSMAKNKPAEVTNIIISSINNLQQAIDENRKIAHELVAPDFETANLADQLTGLANFMLTTASVNVYVDAKQLHEELLTEQQKLTIYRIAQEQCTNIIKYAHAGLVNIFLSSLDYVFKMIIADDGVGVEPDKITDGIGLRNIKARLSIFGGTAIIHTAVGRGFSLEVSMPLEKH